MGTARPAPFFGGEAQLVTSQCDIFPRAAKAARVHPSLTFEKRTRKNGDIPPGEKVDRISQKLLWLKHQTGLFRELAK